MCECDDGLARARAVTVTPAATATATFFRPTASAALFSWPDSASPDLPCDTLAHCSILFVFGNNCPIVD